MGSQRSSLPSSIPWVQREGNVLVSRGRSERPVLTQGVVLLIKPSPAWNKNVEGLKRIFSAALLNMGNSERHDEQFDVTS